MSWRATLARWIDPDTAKMAGRYRFMRGELDGARWWLGSTHPDVASLAEWVLERDYWWATSQRFPERQPWAPPAWVNDISSFRDWLDQPRAKKKRGADTA